MEIEDIKKFLDAKRKEERVLERFFYQGEELGRLVETGPEGTKIEVFQTDLSELDIVDLIREIPLNDRLCLRYRVSNVYRFLEKYGVNPNDYASFISNDDILIYVANSGYANLTDLYRNDRKVWELVKQRGLDTELFQNFEFDDS